MKTQAGRLTRIEEQILERLAAIPGVTSAAYTDALPMQSTGQAIVAVEDKSYNTGELPPTRRVTLVSPGLFRTLETPLLAGRDLNWLEIDNERNVALVSESLARETWGSVAGAIGKRIRPGTDGGWQEVIGVVADIYHNGVDKKPTATVYWPAREHPFIAGNAVPITVAFAIRSDRTGTESFVGEIRQAVSAAAPDLPIAVRTLADMYDASMARTSFSFALLGIAASMALLLGVVGIYGVLAYAVMQRQREVGIRLALGAEPRAVKGMFVYRGLMLATTGIVFGSVAAASITRGMASLLFGVTPVDAVTFAAAAVILVFAALVASYIPARRAAAVDPGETLRGQ
jgi:predicted permease